MLNFRENFVTMIDREQLINILRGAVATANRIDQDVLGVVLFGSRARPACHPYAARPDSDVDLVSVYRGIEMDPLFTLRKVMGEVLNPLHLDGHMEGIILAESLEPKTDRIDPFLKATCRLFDEFSIPITVDGTVTEYIIKLRDSLDKLWIPSDGMRETIRARRGI